MNNYGYLGMVRHGRFDALLAEDHATASYRLTSVAPQAAQTPESGEIALDAYDGLAILVRGIAQGEWIYAATVVEQADQIVTLLVQAVLHGADGSQIRFPQG